MAEQSPIGLHTTARRAKSHTRAIHLPTPTPHDMKEAYYFRHDSNARRDQKIIALRLKYKMEGYGIYWAIIELLRESANYMCVKDYNIVAFDLHVGASTIKSIIEDFGLFEFTEDGKHFYSERLLRDMQSRDELSAVRSEAGKKGMASRYRKANDENADLQQDNNKPLTELQQSYNEDITIRKEKRIREDIEKNSTSVEQKKGKRPAFAPPSPQEVQAYVQQKGLAVDASHFIDFYTAKGWMIGANRMKDWKAAVRNWAKRDGEQGKNAPAKPQKLTDTHLGEDEWAN